MATNACCRLAGISSIVTYFLFEPEAMSFAVSLPSASRTVVRYPVGVASMASIEGAESRMPRITPMAAHPPTTRIAKKHIRSALQNMTLNFFLRRMDFESSSSSRCLVWFFP